MLCPVRLPLSADPLESTPRLCTPKSVEPLLLFPNKILTLFAPTHRSLCANPRTHSTGPHTHHVPNPHTLYVPPPCALCADPAKERRLLAEHFEAVEEEGGAREPDSNEELSEEEEEWEARARRRAKVTRMGCLLEPHPGLNVLGGKGGLLPVGSGGWAAERGLCAAEPRLAKVRSRARLPCLCLSSEHCSRLGRGGDSVQCSNRGSPQLSGGGPCRVRRTKAASQLQCLP